MGFLDNLISSGARKVMSNVVGEVFDKVSDGLSSTVKDVLDKNFPTDNGQRNDTGNSQSQSYQEQSTKTQERHEAVRAVGARQDVEYTMSMARVAATVETVMAIEFREYTLKEKIAPKEIGGSDEARTYTYGAYQGGEPRLFIMITDHNKAQNKAFRFAKQAAADRRIPFVNFYTQFPNTQEYVTDRIKQHL